MPRSTSPCSNILCLDVALTNTGVVIMEDGELVHTSIIKTSKSPRVHKSIDQVARITHICAELERVIEDRNITTMVAELPTGGGQSSAAVEGMSIAKTVIACFSHFKDVELVALTPAEVKKVTGDRHASKTKMKIWASRMFPELRKQYRSTRSRDGFTGDFEHIADALGAYEAAGQLGRI